MAKEDKKEKVGKSGKEKEKGFFKKAVGRVIEEAGSQIIGVQTRPLIAKIPIGIIKTLGRLQFDKFLFVFSTAIRSLLPKGKIWADKLNEVITEFSAELKQRIDAVMGDEEAVDGKIRVDKRAAIGAFKTLFKVLYSPELVGNLTVNLQTLDNIMSGRSDKEVAVIYEIFGSMSESELAMFFDQMSDASKDDLDLFFKRFLPKKKEEKTFKQIVEELKRDIHDFGEGSQVLKELGQEIWTVVLSPIFKTVDSWFANGKYVHEKLNTFHEYASSRRERSRLRRQNQI